MSKVEIYFDEGASDDMGIFAGYGSGWYFERNGRDFGPYDTEQDAQNAACIIFERPVA